MPPDVFAFEVRLWGVAFRVVNHVAPIKAHAHVWGYIREVMEKHADALTVHELGAPQQTEGLVSAAELVGRPELAAGALVRVRGDRLGRVVDASPGGRFDVQVSVDERLYLHPDEIEVVA